MKSRDWSAPISSIRSTWNETRLLLRGPLTDRKITKYAQAGYYSKEYRQARKDLIERKRLQKEQRQARREGNFLVFSDGRKVYSPA